MNEKLKQKHHDQKRRHDSTLVLISARVSYIDDFRPDLEEDFGARKNGVTAVSYQPYSLTALQT